MQRSIFIGLDVHKATISVGVAVGERGGEVRSLGTVPNRPDHVRKLVEKLASNGAQLHFCYEAGPCGYGLHRQLVELGHECIVVAPSENGGAKFDHGSGGMMRLRAALKSSSFPFLLQQGGRGDLQRGAISESSSGLYGGHEPAGSGTGV